MTGSFTAQGSIVEASADRVVIWTKPDDINIDPQNPANGLGGLKKDAFIAVFADSSVAEIPSDTSPASLWALFTYAGGEKSAAKPRSP